MISSAHRSSNSDEDLLYSSATPSHTRRPSWPLSFGFDSNFSNGIPQYTSMSSIPFPSGQTASVRRPQRRRRESGELPQPWMFAPDHQVHRDDSEEVLYVASPPVPQFPPTMSASPSLNGRKRSTRSGYPFADDSSNCIYTASPKPHQPCLPARNVSFPPSYTSTSSPFQPSNPIRPIHPFGTAREEARTRFTPPRTPLVACSPPLVLRALYSALIRRT